MSLYGEFDVSLTMSPVRLAWMAGWVGAHSGSCCPVRNTNATGSSWLRPVAWGPRAAPYAVWLVANCPGQPFRSARVRVRLVDEAAGACDRTYVRSGVGRGSWDHEIDLSYPQSLLCRRSSALMSKRFTGTAGELII